MVVQVALVLKIFDDDPGILFRSCAVTFEGELRVDGRLVGVVHAGEAHWLASFHGLAGLCVQTLYIALFANLNRCVHINSNEIVADHLARLISGGTIGADRGADHCSAHTDNFTGNEANSKDVRIAVFLAETKSLRKVSADNIAIENVDLTSA